MIRFLGQWNIALHKLIHITEMQTHLFLSWCGYQRQV